MNCEEARKRWHECFEDRTEDAGLSDHLRVCAPCHRYVADMDALTSALDDLRVETEEIVSSVSGEAGESSRIVIKPIWLRWGERVLPVAAAIAMVVAAGLYVRHVNTARKPSGERRIARKIQPAEIQPVRLTLQGKSAERYLTVQSSGKGNEPVQVIWLYPLPKRTVSEQESPREVEPMNMEMDS
jgi:hypothetical protein